MEGRRRSCESGLREAGEGSRTHRPEGAAPMGLSSEPFRTRAPQARPSQRRPGDPWTTFTSRRLQARRPRWPPRSGRQDSNLRPREPHSRTLAKLSYAPDCRMSIGLTTRILYHAGGDFQASCRRPILFSLPVRSRRMLARWVGMMTRGRRMAKQVTRRPEPRRSRLRATAVIA